MSIWWLSGCYIDVCDNKPPNLSMTVGAITEVKNTPSTSNPKLLGLISFFIKWQAITSGYC